MIYREYAALKGHPHVVVDGSAQDGTVLTLSHWPGSRTPERYRADLSAEIAFAYAVEPDPNITAEFVTNNHFDQDGLIGVYALTEPELAIARRARMIDVARAGDFSRFEDRDAARAAITIANLGMAVDGDPYVELLPRLSEIVDHVARFRDHWVDQDAHITTSEQAIGDGTVTITDVPDVDLAILTVPESWAERVVQQFATIASNAVHPYALHNSTDRLVVLTVHGAHIQLQYRYETWVHLVSRRPIPRVDLSDLAAELTTAEPGDTRWVFDGVEALSPRLHLVGGGATAIPPEVVIARITETLRDATLTWSPYAT